MGLEYARPKPLSSKKNQRNQKIIKLPSPAASCMEVSGPRPEPKERRVSKNVALMCDFKLFAMWAVGWQSHRSPCKSIKGVHKSNIVRLTSFFGCRSMSGHLQALGA